MITIMKYKKTEKYKKKIEIHIDERKKIKLPLSCH